MIAVEEALARILAAMPFLPAETVGLREALGRVLAEPVIARVTQPPSAVSAMDGYAVRAEDVAAACPGTPVTLRQIGEAPAGGAFAGTVGPGETVRIFTGGPLPQGADAIVIQENTESDRENVTILKPAPAGQSLLTLITCEGSFDGEAHNYSNRRIVVAEMTDTVPFTS